MDNCQCHNEVLRDGSGQLGRYLKALDPSYTPIDGRSIEELLVFAKRYAAQIRFYDIPESKMEDSTPPAKVSWREFFRRDMAVIAASIAIIDLPQIQKDYREIREQLDLHPTTEIFAALFSPILGMAIRIDHWYSVAVSENPLRKDLDLGISSLLHEQMKKIIGYEEGFKYVDQKKSLNLDYSAIENDEVWGLNDSIDPDYTIYTGIEPEDKMRSGALFVDDIFYSFYGFISGLVEKSESYMQFALEQYPAHQPHIALFIAFLQVFKLAQDQMNGVTQRMLEFYYRDVLHLTEKPSIPDRVHIIFELAKDVAEYDLAKGTALKAGKDAGGKEQIYATENDLVINQAKVKELKTIFIEKLPVDGEENDKKIHKIYARPVANSLDGFGEKFTDLNPKWKILGEGSVDLTPANNPCEKIKKYNELLNRNDVAQIGFAIASPQLVLQGGKRLIGIQIKGFELLLAAALKANKKGDSFFEIWLTGEKDWLKIDKMMSDEDSGKVGKYLEAGLFNPEADTIESAYLIDEKENILYVYLPISEVPVVSYDSKLHKGYNFETTYPLMMVMLNSTIDLKSTDYEKLSITDFSLSVKVGSINPTDTNDQNKDIATSFHFDGLKKLILQNDYGIQPLNKAFDPFTPFPSRGKSLYIGSEEVFYKPLGRLAVNIKRTEDEEGFKNNDFNNNVPGFASAVAQSPDLSVSVLHDRSWDKLTTKTGTNFFAFNLTQNILFHTPDKDPNGTPIGDKPVFLPRKPLSYFKLWEPSADKGFLQINTLLPIFSGENFLVESQNLAARLQVKEISVSYESTLSSLEAGIDQFFHVYPFGAVETYIDSKQANAGKLSGNKSNIPQPKTEFSTLDKLKGNLLVNAHNHLLPQFTFSGPYAQAAIAHTTKAAHSLLPVDNVIGGAGQKVTPVVEIKNNRQDVVSRLMYQASGLQDKIAGSANQYSAPIQEEGMLFIGLEKLKPLQTISLLFQFAEGSAADEDNDPPPINWSYLTNNEWRPLKGEHIVSDGTFGFQTTGIVMIDVPEDVTSHNTIITDGLSWFCASVTTKSDRIPQLVDVVTQAVLARFQDDDNAQSHFDKALAAGSISKLAVAVADVAKVVQPFASFDGKHKEAGKEYYTRVSERLRHKARAITTWDYEHIILDRFPSIYKVKCITHTDPNCICRHSDTTDTRTNQADCCGPQVAPGHVLIVPIANFKNRNAADPLQPKTSRRTLLEIQEYLKKRTTPFVHIHAKNPVYEQIVVSFKVKFYTGIDKGYLLKKLNDEIVHYLTPWAFDENADVSFNQKIYSSSIINFIEERPYVDFITDFLMGVCRNECCTEDDNANVKNTGDDNNEDVTTVLGRINGCNDIEHLLQDQGDFQGDIIAKPSTPRSILVSVPQHIIIPYKEPEHLTRCEERKNQKPVVTGPRETPLPPKEKRGGNGPLPARPIDVKPVSPVQPASNDIAVKETKASETVGKPVVPTPVVPVADEETPVATREGSVDTGNENPTDAKTPAEKPAGKTSKKIKKAAPKKG